MLTSLLNENCSYEVFTVCCLRTKNLNELKRFRLLLLNIKYIRTAD